MFEPVNTKQSFPKLEEEVLRFWKDNDIFRKSVEQRPAERQFTFYEGPPYANASPGVHHVLARVFKDVIVRYKTMRGYRVPRKAGWDTHGLPAEVEVERELGIQTKAEIEERIGIAEFNRRCRENVTRYIQEFNALTERIAFWLDLDNAYMTFRNEYIESCWWVVKQLWDKDLLYLDYRSVPHCPRCGTTLSDHEVAQGYQENTPDPSVYVKFRARVTGALRDALPSEDSPAYLLAWTTTPWTLPGDTALAVDAEADYAVVEVDAEYLVLARALVEQAIGPEANVIATLKGSDLVDLTYEPLYDPTRWGVQAMWFDPSQDRRLVSVDDVATVELAYSVLAAGFVSMEDGTGIVHIAPAFGGEDFELGKERGLLFVQPVDLRGLLPEGSPWPGAFVKDADARIIEELDARGLVLKSGTIRHTYPFCWRCGTPLLYYAKPSWYIRTTARKEQLIAGNEQINWYPEHIKRGRFGDWLRNNVDWAFSRERYWGTPVPAWGCQDCGTYDVIGSREELLQRAADPAVAARLEDLHRPYVDEVELRCLECGGNMKRTPEVIDVWFDAGSMPYAQWHYPLENRDVFERSFPADFICEGIDQTRGWFYTLHALSTLVFDSVSYRNCICLELILDEKGEKMSKSKGNVVEPWSVINAHGADALRWYMFTATAAWIPRRFSERLVGESLRRFLLTLWNTYSFFVTYAGLDGFDPQTAGPGEPSELDRWVLAELNALIKKATDRMEGYDPTTAGRAIQQFVDGLSNWYVRRSRRRFWKPVLSAAEGSGADADKLAAYHTLYTCLVTVTKLLAPFAPFVAEAIYQNLVRSVDREAHESVHLADWPVADESLVDSQLIDETRTVMRVVSLGRAARSKAGIKVRQPLPTLTAFVLVQSHADGLRRLADQVREEVNVKEVVVHALGDLFRDSYEVPKDLLAVAGEGAVLASDESGYAVAVDSRITPELADEGLARELVHRLQNMRKAAGFEISDRIAVYYADSQRLSGVLQKHEDYVRQETLANEITVASPPEGAYSEEQQLDGETVTLSVLRSG